MFLNKLVQWGQLYWAFPFSKTSPVEGLNPATTDTGGEGVGGLKQAGDRKSMNSNKFVPDNLFLPMRRQLASKLGYPQLSHFTRGCG